MDCEPLGRFITSVLELKLDATTMFEWQRQSQESVEVPHFNVLLEFINLRAQASESSVSEPAKKHQVDHLIPRRSQLPRKIASHPVSVDDSCVVCKSQKHPLYSCPRFKSFTHDQMISVLRANSLCMNCLRPGHFIKQCTSVHKCRKCQRPHHTLLHRDVAPDDGTPATVPSPPPQLVPPTPGEKLNVASLVAHSRSLSRQALLMTCRVLVSTSHGITTHARALLDSAS